MIPGTRMGIGLTTRPGIQMIFGMTMDAAVTMLAAMEMITGMQKMVVAIALGPVGPRGADELREKALGKAGRRGCQHLFDRSAAVLGMI